MGAPRPRWRVAVAAALTVALGLLTRADAPLPALVAAYGGDTLYATLVYLLVALAWARGPAARVGLVALGLCFAVELSQLARAPWLDALRATLPGRLVLGAGFLWSDLVCYVVGVLIGAAVDLAALQPRGAPRPRSGVSD